MKDRVIKRVVRYPKIKVSVNEHHREIKVDFLRDQCAAADVPFLFKQWEGATSQQIKALGRELDGVVHDGYPKRAA